MTPLYVSSSTEAKTDSSSLRRVSMFPDSLLRQIARLCSSRRELGRQIFIEEGVEALVINLFALSNDAGVESQVAFVAIAPASSEGFGLSGLFEPATPRDLPGPHRIALTATCRVHPERHCLATAPSTLPPFPVFVACPPLGLRSGPGGSAHCRHCRRRRCCCCCWALCAALRSRSADPQVLRGRNLQGRNLRIRKFVWPLKTTKGETCGSAKFFYLR
ncbi:hypothetical protein THAOC_05738 [Thalassiosira oceanica]|uniref:Uncharacterized protein n=1 Tax=Thalassiosira oceanica TaxID=159749 RepID=K0TGI9_THAOC|nr:hypothetical protein THAOC_05738 [Thalassiosira oceanica]|eukprot:EJK72701.1 hypothetical protein THAOC_05738 [Thalassiosira oceanica]